MDKREVLRVLNRFAFASELLGRPQARAWSRAVWVLRPVEGDFSELYHSGELAEIKGVGKGTLAVIGDVLSGHVPTALTELEGEVPDGLFQIAKIRGMGPKKVRALWEGLGITTLGELEYACTENRLVELAGFGAKTQAKVLSELARLATYEGWFRRDRAQTAADALVVQCEQGRVAGELARGAELVQGVVVVCTHTTLEPVSGGEWTGLMEGVAARVRVVEPGSRGLAVVEETSDVAHVEQLRLRAQKLGLDLESLHCADDGDLYAALGLHMTPCERRSGSTPLVEVGMSTPKLIVFADLQGALHNHTVASDGAGTVDQMSQAAEELGLRWIGISEHSEAAAYAGGLSDAAIQRQLEQIRALEVRAVTVLAGVETDILESGKLDTSSHTLALLDYVVASVHQRFRQSPQQMTDRMLAAARHPMVDVVGHPTGRLLLGRPSSGVDVVQLIDVCREVGCAVELNASPHRLDLGAEGLGWARDAGVLVSIAADAHSPGALANLHHGIAVARRAGLTAADVLNTRSASELGSWVAVRRGRALEHQQRE